MCIEFLRLTFLRVLVLNIRFFQTRADLAGSFLSTSVVSG